MTHTEFRAALESLGLSQSAFGRLTGQLPRQVRRWASEKPPKPGEKPVVIPGWVPLVIGLLRLPGAMDKVRHLITVRD